MDQKNNHAMITAEENGPVSSGEKTRAALIAAGLRLFGEKGFAATSTREIAAAANANIGSIAYHFSGKHGLHEACAQHIVTTIRNLADPLLQHLPVPADPQAAQAQILLAMEQLANFLIADTQVTDFVPFILREAQHPTGAFDILYDGLIKTIHHRLCHIWASATGDDPASETTAIMVFAMIGQIVYFRIARELVVRRLGWQEIGPAQTRLITASTLQNIAAMLVSRQGKKS